MEVYKLGKIIENQGIEIQLILHQLNEAREEFKKSLKKRKEISIEQNNTQYKEMDTNKLFDNGYSNEFDATIKDLMETNRTKVKEIRNLKLEQESQAILLCEVTKQKKKVVEDKDMIEDDKRVLTSILEERSSKVTKIANMHLETLGQLLNANNELNIKDIEIKKLKLQCE